VMLVDTGPIVAAALTRDVHHRACVDLFTSAHLAGERLLVPSPGPRQGVKRNKASGSEMDKPSAELVRAHADLPLGAVDAAGVAVAERLNLAEFATVDRRHFSIDRPRHVDAFTLLPQ
jgi:predicted nucleic acid-binding protein